MSGVPSLLSILDLEQLEVNLFRGTSPKGAVRRVFGGQVIGQALIAATRTVEGVLPHSLHAYFLLGGDPEIPIVYDVDRIRDGKSFTTRRVVAIQHGRAIFSMSVSFHNDEDGLDHQMAMPDVPHPDALPSDAEIKQKILPELPEAVRPRQLALRYARLANRICEAWKEPHKCEKLLDELMMDRRGGRKGFPLQVANELATLRDHFYRLHHHGKSAWEHVEMGR